MRCWAAAGAEQCTQSSADVMSWEPAACAADASASETITAPKEQLHPWHLSAVTYSYSGPSQLQRIPPCKTLSIKLSSIYAYWRDCESLKGKNWEGISCYFGGGGSVCHTAFFKILKQICKPQILSWSTTARKSKVKAATWDCKSFSLVCGLVYHMCHSTY